MKTKIRTLLHRYGLRKAIPHLRQVDDVLGEIASCFAASLFPEEEGPELADLIAADYSRAKKEGVANARQACNWWMRVHMGE